LQALAASHSGLRLPNLLKAITARQEELYKRTGSRPKINVKLNELKTARARIAEASLKPRTYYLAEHEVAEAQEKLKAVKDQLGEARRRHAGLVRLEQALPALSQQRNLRTEIDAITAEGVCAPDDIVEALPHLRSARPAVQARLELARKKRATVEQQLSEIDVDELLLEHGDAIDGLSQDRKTVHEALKRRGLSAHEVSGIRKAAERLLQEVHPGASLDDTSLFRLPGSFRDRARKLHERRITAANLLRQAQEAVKVRQNKKEQADKAISGLPPVEDASLLRAAHGAVPPDLLSSIVAAQDAEKRALNRCRLLLNDLKLADFDPEHVVRLPLPTRQQVEEANDKAKDLAADRRDLTKEQRRIAAELADHEQDLARILAHDPPPTPAELSSARRRRDELISRLPADPDLSQSALDAVAEADRLADSMIRHSEKVAERTRLETGIAKQIEQRDRLSQQLHDLDQAAELLDREWAALWEHYPVKAPARGAAAQIFEKVEQLRSAVSELQDSRVSLASRQQQAKEHVERLRSLLREPRSSDMIHLGGATILSELPELLEIAAARLAEHEQAVQKRTALETQAEAEAAELESALAQQAQCEKELREVTGEWDLLLGQAMLPTGHDTEAGLADLDRLAEVADKVKAADDLEHKARQDDHRIAEFQARLRSTADACRITLPDEPAQWSLAVDSLHKKLTQHRAAAQRRAQLETSRRELDENIASFKAELKEIDVRLAEFVTRTGVAGDAGLEPAVDRAERLKTARAELRTISAALPQGEELRDLVRQAEGITAEQIRTELEQLEGRLEELEGQDSHWTSQLATRKANLDRLDGSAEAAQASAEAAMIAADLVSKTEEYLRLELARHYIHTCMDEYRDNDQAPVLRRASTAFRKLTLDSFTGLELSDDENPAILAQRPDGALLTADRLSEGTRDQLYLALRLASLERHADNGLALPLAVDDVFMTFDNERTAAGLHVLHDLTDRFQVIVFTHHEHLVEIATAELPPTRVHIHQLPR